MSIRVCMLLYGGVQRDSRVRREVAALVQAGFDVMVGCLAEPAEPDRRQLDGAHVVALHPHVSGALLPGSTSPFYAVDGKGRKSGAHMQVAWLWRYGRTLRAWRAEALRVLGAADIWHGHDLFGLWTAAALRDRHGGKLVYDSHELFLEGGTAARLPAVFRRTLATMEGRLARSADAVITINESIAAELNSRYGVSPAVVMNSAELGPVKGGHPLRTALGVGERPVILFHGALQEGRGLPQLVDAIPHLTGNPAVVFLGDGPLQDRYQRLSTTPAYATKLYVHDAVDRELLADWVADADVGVIPFQPVDHNHLLATPNRLFEYLAIGVPTVVSDFQEMRRIITESDAGLTCDPVKPASIAAAVNRLLNEPEDRRKERRVKAKAAAHDRYSWHAQKTKLLEVYRSLSDRSPGRLSSNTA